MEEAKHPDYMQRLQKEWEESKKDSASSAVGTEPNKKKGKPLYRHAKDMSLVRDEENGKSVAAGTESSESGITRKGWKRSKFGRLIAQVRMKNDHGQLVTIDPAHHKDNLTRFYFGQDKTLSLDDMWARHIDAVAESSENQMKTEDTGDESDAESDDDSLMQVDNAPEQPKNPVDQKTSTQPLLIQTYSESFSFGFVPSMTDLADPLEEEPNRKHHYEVEASDQEDMDEDVEHSYDSSNRQSHHYSESNSESSSSSSSLRQQTDFSNAYSHLTNVPFYQDMSSWKEMVNSPDFLFRLPMDTAKMQESFRACRMDILDLSKRLHRRAEWHVKKKASMGSGGKGSHNVRNSLQNMTI